MKSLTKSLLIALFCLICAAVNSFAADAKASTLTCVALFSETDEGYISYKTSKSDWIVIKLGDVIPADGTIRITVDRDSVAFTPSNNPNAVYEFEGNDKGPMMLKVADILKGKARMVKFPKVSKDTDPAFKDKLVVAQVMGRQIYRANADTPEKDIQYGDVLDINGHVRIIGINNTLILTFPNGAVTTVVGPLSFDLRKVFEGTNLYKYLNVTK